MDDNFKPVGTLESAATCFGVAALAAVAACAALMLIGDWSFLQGIFAGFVVAVVLFFILIATVGRPLAAPGGADGAQQPTADLAEAEAPGAPGAPAQPLTPRNVNAPSPHRESIEPSLISTTSHEALNDPKVNRALSSDPIDTPMAEAAPATRVPAPAPINADAAGVARPVGATTDPAPQAQPAPRDGAIVSPEPPAGASQEVDRNDVAPDGGESPEPTATAAAQSYNETAPIDAEAEQGVKPETLDGPRGGAADDLKRIKGVGPKLEKLCNKLGFYHFDQIAAWTNEEVAWVDANLEGFKGRVRRDDWVAQAKLLASGGETAFSKKVDEGDVY
ncbi:MAG: hypothetical protein AAF919_01470 [Pseudomonadota bacterium]